MDFGERIRCAREKSGITQGELANKIGVQRAVISKYETGIVTNIPIERLQSLADCLGVSVSYLMGEKKQMYENSAVKVPVLGYVRAGIPLDAIEEILDYEEISPALAARGEYFALRITGDSMEPKFSDGDVVIVRKQSDVDSGNIAVILVNGDGATVKKIKKRDDGVELIPTNPMYDVMLFNRDQIETLPVRIIGKVVELRAKF